MAVDPTFNDTESSSEDAQESSPSLVLAAAGAPPRPPRPAKRSALARIPMPLGHQRGSDMPPMSESEEDSAPPSPVSGLPGVPEAEPAAEFDLTAERAKPPSTPLPRESFDDLRPDPSDRAPSAPLTPWNDVPPLVTAPPPSTPDQSSAPAALTSNRRIAADPAPASSEASRRAASDSSPSRAAESSPPSAPALWSGAPAAAGADLDSSPPVGIEPEDDQEDREDTIVGEVPRRLLDIASTGDEATRAYTAPQELIELARAKKEERRRNKAAAAARAASEEAHSRETERPPAIRRTLESSPEESFEDVMPADPVPPAVIDPRDSAPPVARPVSAKPAEVSSLRSSSPDLSASSSLRTRQTVPPTAPREPAPASTQLTSREPAPESEVSLSSLQTPWFGGARRWLLLAAIFLALGVLLARWRLIEQLLAR